MLIDVKLAVAGRRTGGAARRDRRSGRHTAARSNETLMRSPAPVYGRVRWNR